MFDVPTDPIDWLLYWLRAIACTIFYSDRVCPFR